jgi:hypothetical protein
MTNSVSNVIVGKPKVTGGVLVGPLGTPLPTDAVTPLHGGLIPTGYVTDNGVVKAEKRNTSVLYAWGGDTIAVTQKGYDVSVKVDLAEFLSATVQGLIYGPANVVLTPAVPITLPVLSKGTTSSTGGTFAAGAYFWVVTGVSANGESMASNEVTATLVDSGTQVLSWTAMSGAVSYKVYRGVVSGGENALVATVSSPTVTYTDTGAVGSFAVPPAVGNAGTVGNRMAIRGTSAPTPRNSWVFDIFSDNARIRVVLPNAKVMDVGDTTFVDDKLAAYPLTLQAFPDTTGATFYVYTDDGAHN